MAHMAAIRLHEIADAGDVRVLKLLSPLGGFNNWDRIPRDPSM